MAKELQIGETLIVDKQKIVCVLMNDDDCTSCFFSKRPHRDCLLMICQAEYRTDGHEVMFKLK